MSDVTAPVEEQLEQHRRELTAYCYRMLGSSFEAEDAVQETMVRAWRAHERFEGRSALRSWMYRIATNVCLDMLNGSKRRARPMDLTSAGRADGGLPAPLPEATWIEPIPDGRIAPATADPAELAVARESVRLAFISALQHLAPRQRAVLILREVLAWRASEVAELLETSVPAVNSALQRARAVLAAGRGAGDSAEPAAPMDPEQQKLLARYVEAFERYDLDSLTALLHEDAVLSMPPFDLWLLGRDQVRAWFEGVGSVCRGSKLVPVSANGMPAFGQYHPDPEGGYAAWAIQVLEISDGRITGLNSFLDTQRLFPLFGLEMRLEE
jgi:RNA polymerase sigma-70 factor (ECF subfamily)